MGGYSYGSGKALLFGLGVDLALLQAADFRQQQSAIQSAVRPRGSFAVRARFQMMDPALQAVQSLLHALFIRGGMMQGVIHITDCIIQQGEDFRRGQFFPMRAKSGDVAGERMVKA